MDLPFITIIELALLGLCGGFLAGLLGIGGGMVLVPFLTVILAKLGIPDDLIVKMAIATSMATIVFTSISSLHAHHRQGAVRWELVRGLAPGIVIGGLLCSVGLFAALKGESLSLIFAFIVSLAATQMWLGRKPAAHRTVPGPLGQTLVGSGIGFIAGLVGAGGGFMSVPFMVWCNVPMHNAVATSAALGLPIALANSTGFILGGLHESHLPPGAWGYVYVPALLVIVCASVLSAPLGAKAAHALPVQQLRRIFGFVLYALAGYMAYRALA